MGISKGDADVIVVGAGPAGTTAAIRLARAGLAVKVFEQARFPREKVCGGCLSGTAMMALRDLLGDTLQSPGTAVRRISFRVGRRRFEAPGGDCRIVPRDVLDATLAEAAQDAGVDVHFDTRARLTCSSPGRYAVEIGGKALKSRWVLWCAGLAALPQCTAVKARMPRRRLVGQAWSKTPGADCPPVGEIALHWLRGGYVGLATIDADRCLVALAAESNLLKNRKPWAMLRDLNPEAPLFAANSGDTPDSAKGTAGFPWRPRRLAQGNLLLVGDAAGFEEPFSGEGIGQALQSARAAAGALLAGRTNESVARQYTRALAQHRRVRRRTRLLSRALRNPIIQAICDSPLPVPVAYLERLVNHIHVKSPV